MKGLNADNLLTAWLESAWPLRLRSVPVAGNASVGELVGRLASLPCPVLLDSSARDDRFGRWSVAAFEPIATVSLEQDRLCQADGSVFAEGSEAVWDALGRLLRARSSPVGDCPYGPGWFGYLGYELGRLIEHLPGRAGRDMQLPDLHLGLYDVAAVYDTDRNVEIYVNGK
ncbi:MAG: hypothetical protein ACOCZE_11225, partial [Planctomycetota bacterium]